MCDVCVEMVELMDDERFGRREGVFLRKGAVFEVGSPVRALMWDQERFAKTIAAFFVVQFFRLNWYFPEAIYFPKSLKRVGKRVGKLLGLPFFSGQGSVLCLSEQYNEDEIPTELYFAKLYFLGFFDSSCS